MENETHLFISVAFWDPVCSPHATPPKENHKGRNKGRKEIRQAGRHKNTKWAWRISEGNTLGNLKVSLTTEKAKLAPDLQGICHLLVPLNVLRTVKMGLKHWGLVQSLFKREPPDHCQCSCVSLLLAEAYRLGICNCRESWTALG